MKEIKLEILKASHLEHFNSFKQLSLLYPIDHPKRIKIGKALNKIIDEIDKLK